MIIFYVFDISHKRNINHKRNTFLFLCVRVRACACVRVRMRVRACAYARVYACALAQMGARGWAHPRPPPLPLPPLPLPPPPTPDMPPLQEQQHQQGAAMPQGEASWRQDWGWQETGTTAKAPGYAPRWPRWRGSWNKWPGQWPVPWQAAQPDTPGTGANAVLVNQPPEAEPQGWGQVQNCGPTTPPGPEAPPRSEAASASTGHDGPWPSPDQAEALAKAAVEAMEEVRPNSPPAVSNTAYHQAGDQRWNAALTTLTGFERGARMSVSGLCSQAWMRPNKVRQSKYDSRAKPANRQDA